MGISRRQLAKLGLAIAGAKALTTGQHLALADESKGVTADPKTLEAWWISLENDEPEASRALLMLADRPAEAVAFLKGKMTPLILSPDRLMDLLVKLGSADQNDWKPAFEELEYFDPRLANDLESLMRDVVISPIRERMVSVLSGREAMSLDGMEVGLRATASGGHNFFSRPGGSWWAEADVAKINSKGWGNRKKKWTRAVRAIALLEHIGTPGAVAILKDMATGHPLAQPTREAVEALARIGGKAR